MEGGALSDDLNNKLDRLLAAIEKDGIEILSPDEIASFRELVDVERAYPGAIRSTARIHHAIQATGFLANGVYGVMKWVAGFAVLYVAWKTGIEEWLQNLMQGGRP